MIISLFDLTGNWPAPYKNAGYEVKSFDIARGEDVLDIKPSDYSNVYGVLAAPPCTHFTKASSRFWSDYDKDGRAEYSLRLVQHTLMLVEAWKPKFWAMENPPGRLARLIGRKAVMSFHPFEYAGYLDFEGFGSFSAPVDIFKSNRYKKLTCLWGSFNFPRRKTRSPLDTGVSNQTAVSLVPPGPDRANIRAATPMGFAKAFFEANR
jgi:hypothetical protein